MISILKNNMQKTHTEISIKVEKKNANITKANLKVLQIKVLMAAKVIELSKKQVS